MKRRTQPLVAFLVAVSVTFAAREALAQTRVCSSISVSSPTTPPRTGSPHGRVRMPEFSASDVLDLEFRVMVPSDGSLGGRKVELKIYTPKGHLYQTLAEPIASGSSAGKSTGARRRARYQQVIATLPVAGTTIVNSSLYGRWKVETYVEGDSVPCAKPLSFAIRP